MDENSYLEIRDKFVVKSNDLIQRSRFKLNLQQQKAILFIVARLRPPMKISPLTHLKSEIFVKCAVLIQSVATIMKP